MISEEQVTRAILVWLQANGWTVLDYDFPGGGTGRKFHMNGTSSSKTRGLWIPDIVAVKNGTFLLFENKHVDTLSDYAKIREMSGMALLSSELAAAYPRENVKAILFGIGFSGPVRHADRIPESGVDLVLSVDDDFTVQIRYKDRFE